MKISINQNENQRITLNNSNIQNINVNEDEVQTIRINNTDSQNIGINQSDNQIIYVNESATIVGITDVLVNGVSVVSGDIAYVIVPTKTSELTNDSGYITENDIPEETDPTVPSYVKQISLADINRWNNKQDLLVSGVNIKTINNNNLLGNGNIEITSPEYIAGTGININNNIISNTITSYNNLTDTPTIPNKTSDLINDSDFVSENDLAEVAFTGSYNSLSDTPVIPDSTSDLINDSGYIDNTVNNLTNYTTTTDLNTLLGGKQDTLVSGTNIKTINNNSLLGSGNITISGGTPTDVQVNGTSITSNNVANLITNGTYNSSTNKIATMSDIPTIGNGTLTIQKNGSNVATFTANTSSNTTANITVPTTTSELTNTGSDGTHPYIPTLDSGLKALGVSSGRLFWEYGSALTDTTLANYSDIPTTTSQLTNNSGFIDNTVNNLTNYYTKTEIDNIQIVNFNVESGLTAVSNYENFIKYNPITKLCVLNFYILTSGSFTGNTYTNLFTIPVGYRPSNDIMIPSVGGGTINQEARLYASTGIVAIYPLDNASTSCRGSFVYYATQ